MSFRWRSCAALAAAAAVALGLAAPGAPAGAAGPQAAPTGAPRLLPAGQAASSRVGYIQVYKLPGTNPGPWSVAVDRQQRVWAGLARTNQLGRLDPATGEWHLLPLPAGFHPFQVSAGAGGELWVSDFEYEQPGEKPGRILRVDPETGAQRAWTVPGATPGKFVRTADAFLFTDLTGGTFGAIPMPARTAAELPDTLPPATLQPSPPGGKPGRAPYPYGLAVDGQDRLWYAEAGSGRVIRIAGGKAEAFPVPDDFWAPSDLAIDGRGHVWVAAHAGSEVLEMEPESGRVLRRVRLRAPGPEEESTLARPSGLLVAPDGIWAAEHEGGRIARILPDSYTVVEYPLPEKKGWPQWLAPAPGGGVWYGAYNTGQIGRVVAGAPAFHVRVSLPTGPVRRGESVAGTVEISAEGQSSGELTLELPDLPYEVTGRFDQPTVQVAPGRPATARFTLQVGARADLGPNLVLAGGRLPGVLVTGSAPLEVAPALLGLPGLQPRHLAGLAGAVALGLGGLAVMRKRRRRGS